MTTPTRDAVRQQIQQLVRAGDTKALKAIRDQLQRKVDRRNLHERSRLYAHNPVGWVQERLRQVVWSKQREIMLSVRDNRRTAVRSCHGVGKSHTASLVASWWLDTHPPGEAFVVTSAPTFAQVRAILWRYIRRTHRRGKLAGRVNQTEWHMDDELVAFGRKPADHDESAFQGIHARYVLVILDEACGIPEQLWVAADALTTNADCRILAIGNPDNPSSYFRKVCQPGGGWHVIGISAFESPTSPARKSPRMSRRPSSAASGSRRRPPSGARTTRCTSPRCWASSARTPPTRSSAPPMWRSAVSTPSASSPPTSSCRSSSVSMSVAAGIETVIRERRGQRAGREWRAHTDRPEKIAPLVLQALKESGAATVKVDSIGVGFGVIGELRNLASQGKHSARIVGVNVGEKSSQPDKFKNLRAEIWWELARGLSERQGWDLSQMENADTTVAQMLEPLWIVDARGRIQVEPKDEIRKRLGRSPDNADALLLAFYSAGRTRVRWL
ncbi:hypothetical protein WKI71_36580 [Streptomyces sp. MS1.AVA.1]|uniref:Terminase n=1 Tax=Streptomyces machairae TaxID=3134109 RepID=A0ABU8USI5_9ACTN